MTSFPLESLIPHEPARWTLLAAVGTVVGVAISRWPVAGLAVVVVLTAVAVRSHRVIALTAAGFVLAGIASGVVASTRLEATTTAVVPNVSASMMFTLVEDASSNRYGVAVGEPSAINGVAWSGPRVAVVGLDEAIDVGARIEASGHLRPGVRRVRDEIVAGTFIVDVISVAAPSRNPVVVVGNMIRRRVQNTFDGDRRSDGLTLGLLIGDTRYLRAHDAENLRRAGLAHYVAVSGDTALDEVSFTNAHIALRAQGVIATLRRVSLMVSSIRGFVEVFR